MLKTILIKLRNLIDKIIAKIDKPQPIHFTAFPECAYTGDPNDFGWHTSDFAVTNYTLDGTSTSINIYSEEP